MTAPNAPVKTLAALTLAVLLAHALVLQATSVSLQASDSKVTRAFSTRVIEIKAAAAGSEEPVAVTAPQPVAPAKKPVTRRSADAKPDTTAAAAVTLKNDTNQAFADVPYTEFAIDKIANGETGIVDPPVITEPVTEPGPIPVTPSITATAPTDLPSASAPSQTTQTPQAVAPSNPPAATAAMTSTIAYTVPGSVRLKYNVSGSQKNLLYSARAELLWLQDGTTYEARQEVGAFLLGSRTFTSTGRMTADGLAPLRYSDKARNELAAHFDRERQRVTFSANTPEAALQNGAQDRVSVFVQLASMLAGAPEKYPAGTSVTVQIIGPRATEVWAIAVEGEEKLNLPGGEISAIKLSRLVRGEFDLKTEFWLAPALGYLPARIRFTQVNGDFVDMAWRATQAP